MTRPLQLDSIRDLTAMADRNWDKASELDLIYSELKHRSTNAAAKLRDQVETWMRDCETFQAKGAQPGSNPRSSAKADTSMPRLQQASQWTYEAIAKLRAKLINLSRSSPLISFKHSSRSVSQLRFVDERPDMLFDRLSKGTMGFEPLPGEEQTPADERTPEFGIAYERARLTDGEFIAATEKLGDAESDARAWQDADRALRGRVRAQLGLPTLDYGKSLDVSALAKAHGFDPSYDLKFSDDGDIAAHHEDDNIRVLLTRKELDRRLKSINDRATSHLRETGHHTLHLAIGFVQWFEDNASDLVSHAPLLLLPVSLEKDDKRARKEFRLALWEGGLEVNVALIEKARDHWGLQLPTLRPEETPESYFIRVQSVLEEGQRLTLRSFITLSVLPPMVLWRDLDPAKWPADAFANHRLLPGLIGATEITGVQGDDSIIDIDDPAHAARVPALITDADASQHRAIMDMAAGRDMAIEGPPGTGKSQTITNMIATALAQGKKVLFVAEKQAALRVVSDRLRAAGFGPFLLELHGDKASRAEVYDGVRERLAASPLHDSTLLDQKRAELRRHRDLLRRYLSLVRTPLGKLGKTAHALAWREIRLRELFSADQIRSMQARWSLKEPLALDPASVVESRELLAQFGRALLAIDNDLDGADRTRWTLAGHLDPFDQSDALNAATKAASAADAVSLVAVRLAECGIVLPTPGSLFKTTVTQLSSIKAVTCTDELVVGAALQDRLACAKLLAAQRDWRGTLEGLKKDVDKPDLVTRSEAEALQVALLIDRCPITSAEATRERTQLEQLLKAWKLARRDIERLSDQLDCKLDTTVKSATDVVKTMALLGSADHLITSFCSLELLDHTSDSVIAVARREADLLIAELNALTVMTGPDALSTDASELDALAETLESTGAIARLFSRAYKAAQRQGGRLLAEPSDRLATASTLRRVAAFARQRGVFYESSKARPFFSPVLWDGISSDFVALMAARTLIIDVIHRLAAVDETQVFRGWLTEDATERQAFLAACERLVAPLDVAAISGFATVPLCDLEGAIATRIDALSTLITAAGTAGLRPQAALLRDAGASVAQDMLNLHEARHTFDAECGAGLEWVDSVLTPLQLLQQSLDELELLFDIPGPVRLRPLLLASDAPAALLSKISETTRTLIDAARDWDDASGALASVAEIDAVELVGELHWDGVARLLGKLARDRSGAGLAADLLKYRAALKARELDPLAQAGTSGDVPPALLDDMYELLALSAVTTLYLGGDGQELGRLGSLTLDAARKSFKRVDKELHKLEAQAIVALRLRDEAPAGVGYGPKSTFSEKRLLESEVALTRPRTPLRDVAHRAGKALQALKPVWMMSPTSAAQFIRPGSLTFDLLIVDEASQMRPEFSVSCILRADQFIVVGDANQLPPSDHFQVTAIESETDDGVGVDESTESILDLANQRFRTKPRLKWHYRSQHESLIQFSNREFYERDLVVFPSPMGNDDDLLGVKCFYTPDYFSDTVYESSINQREAELIIEQAFGLMQSHPECSIGIVAMNAKQTELIQNEFERLTVAENRVRKYKEAFEGTIDEFFIKNLENVQGDERDIILISTVYGPGKDGNIRQNFGLINRETGWRRLNVLVTRAKMSCRLITSLRPDDIKVTETSSRGVIAFKSYLTYAHGGAQYNDASGGETDSDFEIFVADALRSAGYEIVYQVGVENFRIDLGVRHKSCPIGFIAGIECDGAPYHSGLSVRDRDHIRQAVLENLGWNIYRVWSTDWFADSARETAKLVSWVDGIRDRTLREFAARTPVEPVVARSLVVDEPKMTDQFPHSDGAGVLQPAVDERAGPTSAVVTALEMPREPRGRELRAIGDFQTFEAVRGRLYEIWKSDRLLGEVEVIKRATGAPRLYGGRALTEKSEYEGRIEQNGEWFRSLDLYDAMREVAARALKLS